jgi:homoserine kinase
VAITENEIPICRGLGSSSSLIVAGAVAANAIHGNPLSRLDLLAVCVELEGHPDNLAPALLGGLVTSYVEAHRPLAVRYNLHKSLRFTALIPDFELSTHLARSVLPKSVPFADAIFNISRAAVLLKSLEEGNEDLIRTALVDRLHQPYRAPLIPGYEELRARALESGALAFCISGAGPTLLCLSMDEGFDAEMEPKLGALPNNWRLLSLPIDHEGVQIWEE